MVEITDIEDGFEERLDIIVDASTSAQDKKANTWKEIRVSVNDFSGNDRSVQALKRKYSEKKRNLHRHFFNSFPE